MYYVRMRNDVSEEYFQNNNCKVGKKYVTTFNFKKNTAFK